MPGFRKHLAQRFPEAQSPVAYGQLGRMIQATFPQASEQLTPAGFRLPVAIFNSHQLLVAVLSDPNDHQQAEPVIQADIAVDTVRPPVNVALLAQVTVTPLLVLLQPLGLEPGHRIGGQPLGLLTDQGVQSLLKVARGDPSQVEPRDELIQTPSPLQVRRQELAVKANAGAAAVSDLGHLNVNIPNACLDCALG